MRKAEDPQNQKTDKSELDKFKLFYEQISDEKAPVSHHLRLVRRPRK